MKVAVKVTVDIDIDAYRREYFMEDVAPDMLKEDIREHVKGSLSEASIDNLFPWGAYSIVKEVIVK